MVVDVVVVFLGYGGGVVDRVAVDVADAEAQADADAVADAVAALQTYSFTAVPTLGVKPIKMLSIRVASISEHSVARFGPPA